MVERNDSENYQLRRKLMMKILAPFWLIVVGEREQNKSSVCCVCCTQLTADCGLCRKENNPESHSRICGDFTHTVQWTYFAFQWLKLTIWVLAIHSIFKFENWVGTLGSVTFWKFGVFCEIPKFMKTANQNLDLFCQFQIQIIAKGKPFEITGWNQLQMIS